MKLMELSFLSLVVSCFHLLCRDTIICVGTLSIRLHKEVVHFGNLLRYLLAASARNMTLKTLQPGHWEVKDFFTQN